MKPGLFLLEEKLDMNNLKQNQTLKLPVFQEEL